MSAQVLELTARIAVAYINNNEVTADALPAMIQAVYQSLVNLDKPELTLVRTLIPAVPVKQSVFPDFLVCLDDGLKLKTLKRHLMTSYGMTPDDYRTKWGLPPDYPMVAPRFAATRSSLAKSRGLGRKRTAEALKPEFGTKGLQF